MDDKEYYSMMNRTSSYVIMQALKKKKAEQVTSNSSGTGFVGKTTSTAGAEAAARQSKTFSNQTYANLELRQGKADAEMLMEKEN